MTAASGSNARAVTDRCLQVLQFAKGSISAVLQAALVAIRSTYHLVWPQLVRSLAGEIVLITGAGHGIGRQLAIEFWEKGSTVICVDIDEESNQFTARTINTRHRHRLEGIGTAAREGWRPAHAYTCDVTDKNQVEELAQHVLRDLGRVDILVNNAGMKPISHMEATEVVVDAVNVNLLSHFWTLLAFVPGMVKRNHGHVVAVSSAMELSQVSDKLPYSAVTGLMDSLYEELRENSHNIRLTCAHLCVTDKRTDLLEQLDLGIPELSPEHAAREIVSAVLHNKITVIVPHNLLFWQNVLKTLPQDARGIWQGMFHARVAPDGTQSPAPRCSVVSSNRIKA